MSTPDRLTLEPTLAAAQRWDWIAAQAARWAARRAVALRALTVLVPYAQLLGEARRAFARRGGWMPRVETTLTLAAALGPPAPWQPGQLSFDATVDAAGAAGLLRAQSWAAAWERRDPRGFARAVAMLAQTAQALARAAQAVPPPLRAAHWERARERLEPLAGPAALERALSRIALEWAAAAGEPHTDRLFANAGARPWMQVRSAPGGDALGDALIGQATAPCLVVDCDPPGDDPLATLRPCVAPRWAVCTGFEDEAQCAAAQVIEHVRRAQVPVALVAQDRVLVRRVRAVLERHGVRVHDETGWTLSTTRAAARVMALLRACGPQASTDTLLDWLKGGAAHHAARLRAHAGAGFGLDGLDALEHACRRGSIARVAALQRVALEPPAAALWDWAAAVREPLAAPGRRTLAQWLQRLRAALSAAGDWAALGADEAGVQVLGALRLGRDDAATPVSAWPPVVADEVLGWQGFAAWVDGVLERATYVPAAAPGEPAQVVITPMGRAVLRPFAAVVLPGADDQRLGAMPAPHPLLGDTLGAALGLADAAQLRQRELHAFVHLMAVPEVTLLRRRVEAGEPLGDSALVERLVAALAARGQHLTPWQDPRVARRWGATPVARSQVRAAALLPQRLSASACEALRACPYRFFAQHMLGLRDTDELERELEKRDYGTWLHAVLHAFHEARGAPAAADEEVAALHAAARAHSAQIGLEAADFVPFAASFAGLAPRYVAWLHARDLQGRRWRGGELSRQAFPGPLQGVELHGVIDRIDSCGEAALELIDYKTGSAQALRDRVAEPLEDTQLAFYATLMGESDRSTLSAIYLALDETHAVQEVAHPDVARSAAALVQGLAVDLSRLRAGASLIALGEGRTCEHCAARGVCRRDDWASAQLPASDATPDPAQDPVQERASAPP